MQQSKAQSDLRKADIMEVTLLAAIEAENARVRGEEAEEKVCNMKVRLPLSKRPKHDHHMRMKFQKLAC
jgi:hypothetical protein